MSNNEGANMNTQAALQLGGAAIPGHVTIGQIEADSKVELHRAILSALVKVSPGKTSAEYAKRIECKGFGNSYYERRVEAARRLSELELTVRQGRKRKCLVCKKMSFTWWPYSFGKGFSGGAPA